MWQGESLYGLIPPNLPRHPNIQNQPITFAHALRQRHVDLLTHFHFSTTHSLTHSLTPLHLITLHQLVRRPSIAVRMASTSCFSLSTTSLASRTSQRQLCASAKPAAQVACRAQKQQLAVEEDGSVVSRRLALTALIGAAAVGSRVAPADAAYGESANVFGKPKTNTEFMPYNGDGFKLSIPSKWNPSKEVEYPGQVVRYEDNFDATSNLSVMITPTDKKSISDYGPPEEFLGKVNFLLGKQAYFGKTDSEGGFDSGAVATANLLDASKSVANGKEYYYLSVLTRTADGDEGGKHLLITAAVKDGKLYVLKAQAGDKRWFKGARKFVENVATSFSLA